VPAASYLVAAVLVSAAVTGALRALPFAILAPLRSSALVRYLGVHMPAGVMTVLVVYTVATLPGPPAALAVALAVTVGLHLWRRNLALSMAAGTIVYVVLATTSGT
jgi:branched-subunit amino acid transport protein AzlD